MNPGPYQIFLSYSRRDAETMQRIKQDLSQHGFHVWTDEHIEVGTPSWQVAIERAIRKSLCLVVILSPDAVESKWVREEMSYAQNLNKRIFPMLARGDARTAVPFGYSTAQWVDIRTWPDYQANLPRLVQAIHAYSRQASDPTSVPPPEPALHGGQPAAQQQSSPRKVPGEVRAAPRRPSASTAGINRRRVVAGLLVFGLVIALVAGGLFVSGFLDSGDDDSAGPTAEAVTYFDGAIALELPDGWQADEASDEFNSNLILATSQELIDTIIHGHTSSESEALLRAGDAAGYIGFFEDFSSGSAQETLKNTFFLPEDAIAEAIRLDNGQSAAQYVGAGSDDQYMHFAIIGYGNHRYAFLLFGSHRDFADRYAADFEAIAQSFRADIDRAYETGIVALDPAEDEGLEATPAFTPGPGSFTESQFILGTGMPTPTLGVFE